MNADTPKPILVRLPMHGEYRNGKVIARGQHPTLGWVTMVGEPAGKISKWKIMTEKAADFFMTMHITGKTPNV